MRHKTSEKGWIILKSIGYWKLRKKLLNLIFKIKKVGFMVDNRRQSSKEYNSFTRLLIVRFIYGTLKGIILALILAIIDRILSGLCETQAINRNILADIIIGELGVAGVILGLYCSNISSVYSTRYANAPEKIAIAFQYDRLTVRCLDAISSFIIYGTIILIEILMDYNTGWISVGALIIWSILVVISFGITGNRIYRLSDVFRVSDDAHIFLRRLTIKSQVEK